MPFTWYMYVLKPTDICACADQMPKGEKNTTSGGTSGDVARASYHDDSPRDFGLRITYTSWRWFQVAFGYLSPLGQGSEGGKSRPLDHMRQIPFLGSSVPPYYFD